MLKNLSIALIQFYRKYISKHKGFKCAYGVKHGRNTCSGIGLKAFKKAGFFKGMKLLRRQFDRCIIAHYELKEANPDIGKYKRLSYHHSSQRGFVDCGDACGSCDVGHCIPSCDLPTVDCHFNLNKCNPCDMIDFINLCDCLPDASNNKKNEAQERMSEIMQARQERREENSENV